MSRNSIQQIGQVEIGGIQIGQQCETRVIGELGICHRGDLEIAKSLATGCANAGVDFIKFEIYQLETALSEFYRGKFDFDFSSADGPKSMELFEAYKSGYLDYEKALKLIAHIKNLGIPFFATVLSIEEADFMVSNGAAAVKLSSGEIGHIPLIEHLAKNGVPVFIDAATTYIWEVVRAAETYLLNGGKNLVVMHNPAGYPAPTEYVDYNRMEILQSAIGMPVGYTCHTPGRNAVMAAIGAGATIVEKPVSPDNQLPFIEYVFSENISDMKSFVGDVRFASAARGNGRRLWSKEQMNEHRLHRHGLVANRDIKKGDIVHDLDIKIARPGFGLAPEFLGQIIGMEFKRDVSLGEAVTWDLFKDSVS